MLATNDEAKCPLWHGEMSCIKKVCRVGREGLYDAWRVEHGRAREGEERGEGRGDGSLDRAWVWADGKDDLDADLEMF